MDWQPRRLQAWLRDQLAVDESITVLPVEDGFSNENYLVSSNSRRWFLRKPPVITSHQSAHNVLREYRVLEALQATAVHVPHVVASCNDRSVIGTPFILMDWVDGERIDQALPDSYRLFSNSWQRIGEITMQQLITLHQVDWQALGLQDLGCIPGFLERQVERWMAQFKAVQDRYPQLPLDLNAIPVLAGWLQRHCPAAGKSALLHGDYHWQNLLYSRQPPIRALAVVDWELATLGDCRLDLASAISGFQVAGFPPALIKHLVDDYARAMAIELGELPYFQVLAAWKRAVILVSRYASHSTVASISTTELAPLRDRIHQLLQRATKHVSQTA